MKTNEKPRRAVQRECPASVYQTVNSTQQHSRRANEYEAGQKEKSVSTMGAWKADAAHSMALARRNRSILTRGLCVIVADNLKGPKPGFTYAPSHHRLRPTAIADSSNWYHAFLAGNVEAHCCLLSILSIHGSFWY